MRTMSACSLTVSLKSLESVMVGGTAVRGNCEADSCCFDYTGRRLLWRSCGRKRYPVDGSGKPIYLSSSCRAEEERSLATGLPQSKHPCLLRTPSSTDTT